MSSSVKIIEYGICLRAVSAVNFGFAGINISPCAIPITPLGVGIFPQGVNINPIGAYITPIGVNVQPQVCLLCQCASCACLYGGNSRMCFTVI